MSPSIISGTSALLSKLLLIFLRFLQKKTIDANINLLLNIWYFAKHSIIWKKYQEYFRIGFRQKSFEIIQERV